MPSASAVQVELSGVWVIYGFRNASVAAGVGYFFAIMGMWMYFIPKDSTNGFSYSFGLSVKSMTVLIPRAANAL